MTDTTYLAGQTEKDGVPRLETFRVPLSDFKKVRNIEWNEIRYARIALSGIDSDENTLQIAKIEIVGNEWQEMGIVEPEISNRNILIDKIKPKYIDP